MDHIIINEVWKYCKYEDIVTLLQTCNEYRNKINNDNTWIYLIQRDFFINWNNIKDGCKSLSEEIKPRDYYELYHLIVPEYGFIYQSHYHNIKLCPNCNDNSGPYKVNNVKGVCYNCCFTHYNHNYNHAKRDGLLLKKLKQIASNQSVDNKKFLVTYYDKCLIVNGYNIYDVIIKMLYNKDIDIFSIRTNYSSVSLYLFHCTQQYIYQHNSMIFSILDLLNYLNNLWNNFLKYRHNQHNIKDINDIPQL